MSSERLISILTLVAVLACLWCLWDHPTERGAPMSDTTITITITGHYDHEDIRYAVQATGTGENYADARDSLARAKADVESGAPAPVTWHGPDEN